jgi:hypothetical protein
VQVNRLREAEASHQQYREYRDQLPRERFFELQ